jgi:hypothetical protein
MILGKNGDTLPTADGCNGEEYIEDYPAVDVK